MKKLKVYTLSFILITVLGPVFVIFIHYTKTSVFMNIYSSHSGGSTRYYSQDDLRL